MKIELHDFDSCVSKSSNKILTLICQNTDKFKISEISLFLSEYAQSSTITLACNDEKIKLLLLDILNDKRNSK
jgi:hypothetical protein